MDFDLADVGHVQAVIRRRLDIGLRHNAAHRHRYIHTNKPLFITIRYETVRTARPGPFAEPAFADKQVDAFLRRNVVFRKVLHNRDTALYASYGERRHVEVRKVRRIDEDMVRDRAIVVLCRFPGVQNRVVNILQNAPCATETAVILGSLTIPVVPYCDCPR